MPLTGPLASAGIAIKSGVELAAKDFQSSADLDLIFEDNQYNPQIAISSLKSADAREKLSAVIIFGGPTTLAVRSYLENRKIPTIALSAATQLDQNSTGYIKRIWESADTMAELIAGKIQEFNPSDIAVITTENDTTLRLEKTLTDILKTIPVLNEIVSPQETDFKAIATKIRSKKINLIVSNVLAGQHALLVSKIKEQKVEATIISQSSIFFDSAFRSPFPDIFKGMLVASVDDSKALPLYDRLPAELKPACSVYMTALAYDAFSWLYQAKKSGWDMTSPLNTEGFNGVLGNYREITASSYEPPLKMIHVEN